MIKGLSVAGESVWATLSGDGPPQTILQLGYGCSNVATVGDNQHCSLVVCSLAGLVRIVREWVALVWWSSKVTSRGYQRESLWVWSDTCPCGVIIDTWSLINTAIWGNSEMTREELRLWTSKLGHSVCDHKSYLGRDPVSSIHTFVLHLNERNTASRHLGYFNFIHDSICLEQDESKLTWRPLSTSINECLCG